MCKNVRGPLLKYFLNATVLIEFGLFLRGAWQASAFIDAYSSLECFACHMSLLHFFEIEIEWL